MENKESTTSSPKGVCEKIFKAFNPASRPHRRLTNHHQEPQATTIPSPTQPNHSLDSGIKEPSPQKAFPTPMKPRTSTPDQKKPSEAIAPKAELKPTTPRPPPTSVLAQKVPGKVEPTPARPKPVTIPQPAPPKAVTISQPAPPNAAVETAADERSKKNINQRVEEYIKRAKLKIRAVSGVGRPVE